VVVAVPAPGVVVDDDVMVVDVGGAVVTVVDDAVVTVAGIVGATRTVACGCAVTPGRCGTGVGGGGRTRT